MRAWAGAAIPLVATVAAAAAVPEVHIPPSEIAAHVRFLADDLLEGRKSGTRGHRVAEAYVASVFEAAALEPGAAEGSFLQAVPLRHASVERQRSSVAVHARGRRSALVPGTDYVLIADVLRTESSVRAPVIFVGHGVSAPGLGHDDYAGVDVRGAAVAVLGGAPERFPEHARAWYSSPRIKHETAAAHGAVGVLTLRSPDDERDVPWRHVRRHAEAGTTRWVGAEGVPHGVRPEIQGEALLSRDGAEKLFARAGRSLQRALRDVKAGRPAALRLPVEIEILTRSRHTPVVSQNVLARLPGSDPALSGESVVFTAHLDHLGRRGSDGDTLHNGAYDNASGVAMLLEIARAFAAAPRPPRRSVLFAAVTAEELGLLGSDFLAEHPPPGAGTIVANLNLDMVLMLEEVEDVVAYGAQHSTLGAIVEEEASALRLAISPDPIPEQAVFVRSDQLSFVRRGIPSIFLEVGHGRGGRHRQRMELWMRDVYHTPEDEPDQPMHLESGARFALLNFRVGWRVADAQERPRWNPGDFFESSVPPAP